MKQSPNLHGDRPSAGDCSDPLERTRRRAATTGAALAKQRKERVALWRTAIISGCAIIAVFVYLDRLKPAPKPPQTFTAEVLREPPPNPAAESIAQKPEAPTASEPPVASTTDASEPAAPPVAFTPADPVVAESSEADKLAAEPELRLTGLDAQRDAAMDRDRELLARTIQGQAWDAYRALLAKSVKAGLPRISRMHGVNRFDPLWDEPVLYQALLRWKTLSCFPESEISPRVHDADSAEFLTWLLNHNEAMEELLLTFRPQDHAGKVLGFLIDAWSVSEKQFQKYHPLALACAVVFDEPMALRDPAGESAAGVNYVDPLQRYRWYIEKNEAGKLAAPVDRSSARDLVWAVSAPVIDSELEWAVAKMHYRRRNWGNAYGEIEYLMERAVEGLDPYEEYTFEEILKEGGICGDQSYFCAYTARAQGIPAMILSGETDLGGHAWVGMKIDSDEWTTGIGRIGGVSKGETTNPQTRENITEQEILLWNDRRHRSPAITLGTWRHLWLADYFSAMGNDEDQAAAVRLAHQIGPSFTETWRALYSLLESRMQLTGDPAKPNNLDEWKAFATGMRAEFKDNPRMAELAAEAELEYIFPYGSNGDATRQLLRERRRIERNSGEQADLIASALKREAELISKRGGPDANRDISRLYDRALRDYGGSITGFKMMAGDYFGYLKDDPELARKAARDIELAFKRVVETGTKDWFRAKTESSIYKMICGYYRAAGDSARAEMLEKRYEVLLRRAERSAL